MGRGNLLAALNDSAYMMSVEKNSDLVKMASYAPLLENVNKRDWEVNLIHFDSSRVFGRASYYACKLFAENRPDVNLSTQVQYQPARARPITGRIGLGTYNTAAEFKDVQVEQDGKILYQSDFSKGEEGWGPEPGRRLMGKWVAADGVYRQQETVTSHSYFGDGSWSNITVRLKARKLKGAEGFVISVGTADGRCAQWNVGGWNNHQHAIQTGDAIVGKALRGSVEEGRWYDVKVEVKDRTVRGYLDGQLVQEETLPRVDTVLAIAGRDDASGDIIMKVVNSGPKAAGMAVKISGAAKIQPGASVTVLTSADMRAENSFEEPRKIAPVTQTISGAGAEFRHEFPPYSLSILRLKTR